MQKTFPQNHLCKLQQFRFSREFTSPSASRAPSILVEHLKNQFLGVKMVKRPGFFKFYLPSLGEENLKIPSRFIQSIQGTWPMNLALRDRYNNLWHVKVELVGGDWYFKDGWPKFADENMLKGGDLLVYEYFSQGLVDFKVHDGSACLTKGVGGLKTKSTEQQYITIESDGDVDQEITQQEGRRDDNPQRELVWGGTASTCKRKMKRDYDWYGLEIFKTGLVPQPKNPYFVTKKRKLRAGELYIPMDVIRGYNLKLPEVILLLDPKGRQFRATRKVWQDKRMFYVGGWKALCGMNAVGDEDSCICEFLQNDDVFCISISFFPPKRQQQ